MVEKFYYIATKVAKKFQFYICIVVILLYLWRFYDYLTMRDIELLSPAKNYDGARAAVDYGADALYMGGAKFGARERVGNSVEDIARAVEYAHQYGVRLYITMNTLLFEGELAEAERIAREVVATGVDALIVQDMAYARMGLGVELHASTQMCNSTVEGVRFLSELGFRRVVMERNLSLDKLREISKEVEGVDMEVFVHGAICVGHSGRCLLSRSMNAARSGNRGACSQPCRLRYDLVDEAGSEIIRGRHLLSVMDMNLSSRIGDLLDVGVSSFKIEGRLKEEGYIKNIVAHYRRKIDEAMAQREGFARSSVGRSLVDFETNPAKSFSRGETTYMLDGGRRGVASFDTPKSIGEAVGRVAEVRGDRIRVALRSGVQLSTGDGVSYVVDGEAEGSSINFVAGDVISLSKSGRVAVGTQLYRNFDRVFEAALQSSRTRRTIAVEVTLRSGGGVVEVEYRDAEGVRATAKCEGEYEVAAKVEQMERTIREQLSKCGDTIFEATQIDVSGWGGEFIAAKQLATLRREALTTLRERRLARAAAKERDIFKESPAARYPSHEVGGEVGVTNSLSEALYRDHGVECIAVADELRESYEGVCVLRSNYCIRREVGECLKEGSRLRDPLYLVRGGDRFRLSFDCKRCEMSLIKE